jgi:pimeloyl-ACP methyl ester carboxylesterase/membrane protein DedA with SNARE-associated domain
MSRGWKWLATYCALVAASHFARWYAARGGEQPRSDGADPPEFAWVDATVGPAAAEPVFVAYRRFGAPDAPAIVLLHGSPGSVQDFASLARRLADRFDVIVPDLPGFGQSQRDVPDYSARAHAAALSRLLESLAVERAHLVGFSMGGAVALEAWERAPRQIASITMVAALGVEELELFGDHRLNHAVHRAQYALIRAIDLLVPHFGTFDRFPLGLSYARNFLDTDQRRLRGILTRYDAPMRIVHGEHDRLVPYAAAREHHRIVPQSDLITLNGDHFLLWTHATETADSIAEFVARVERGEGAPRSAATPERTATAGQPFAAAGVPSGLAAEIVLGTLLAFATLVSEDLTCIGAGFLVGADRLSWLAAILGCLLGIFVGDLLLFLAGRAFRKPLLALSGAKWNLVSPDSLARGRDLLGKHGGKAILLSRFTPGLRLPTYLAAGALGMPLLRFAAWFLLAAVLWTPLLVFLAARFGAVIEDWLAAVEGAGGFFVGASVLIAAAIVYCGWRLLVSLATSRGRRLLRGRFERMRRYEFWPPFAFYPPVIAKLLQLSWRHRKDGGFSVVTAVNPGIDTSGFIGESKSAILAGLRGAGERVARHVLLRAADSPDSRIAALREFRARHGIDLPIVLKPDVGQRGSGVGIFRDEAALEEFVRQGLALDHVAQEYVAGVEYGIFWWKEPGAKRGRIYSVTEKRMPVLIGDGRRTLEQLILGDDRAVCVAATYFEKHRSRLGEVPAAGERIQLVELGTHCRGAIFLDGQEIVTPALEAWIEEVSGGFEGFAFGRYDIRGPSPEHFKRAEGIRVIELNGVTSEATHLYDPKHSLREAYAILFEQWRVAFEIGAANVRAGASTTSPIELLRRFLGYRKEQRQHR